MQSRTIEDFLLGAIVGGFIGAATALMLAPTSGRRLRRKLREWQANLPNGDFFTTEKEKPETEDRQQKEEQPEGGPQESTQKQNFQGAQEGQEESGQENFRRSEKTQKLETQEGKETLEAQEKEARKFE